VIQQAGAVVVRLDGPEPRFLLVKARRDPTVWIFPKGHVEDGETAEETALRETQEEAGVIGRVLAPIGALEFESGGTAIYQILASRRPDARPYTQPVPLTRQDLYVS